MDIGHLVQLTQKMVLLEVMVRTARREAKSTIQTMYYILVLSPTIEF